MEDISSGTGTKVWQYLARLLSEEVSIIPRQENILLTITEDPKMSALISDPRVTKYPVSKLTSPTWIGSDSRCRRAGGRAKDVPIFSSSHCLDRVFGDTGVQHRLVRSW